MPNISNAARDIPQLFKPDLQKDEKIVWSGQPVPSLFSAGDIIAIPFSLLWGGFAYFWEGSVVYLYLTKHNPALLFMVAWGIPFVVIGSYMMWGRFIVQHFQQKNLFFALTNQRALILSTFRGRSTQAIFLDQLPSVNKQVNSKGIGSIYFGDMNLSMSADMTAMQIAQYKRGVVKLTGFTNIKDVDKVYNLIAKQQKELKKAE